MSGEGKKKGEKKLEHLPLANAILRHKIFLVAKAFTYEDVNCSGIGSDGWNEELRCYCKKLFRKWFVYEWLLLYVNVFRNIIMQINFFPSPCLYLRFMFHGNKQITRVLLLCPVIEANRGYLYYLIYQLLEMKRINTYVHLKMIH